MRPQPDQHVIEWFKEIKKINISIITVEEILSALMRKHYLEKAAWFRRFIADYADIIPLDTETALWAGEARGRLLSRGITVTQADSFIAASAWRGGFVLAARNIRDFEHFGIPLFNPFQKVN
jgi:predicted nucleic acid-binding protein